MSLKFTKKQVEDGEIGREIIEEYLIDKKMYELDMFPEYEDEVLFTGYIKKVSTGIYELVYDPSEATWELNAVVSVDQSEKEEMANGSWKETLDNPLFVDVCEQMHTWLYEYILDDVEE